MPVPQMWRPGQPGVPFKGPGNIPRPGMPTQIKPAVPGQLGDGGQKGNTQV